MNAIKNNQPLDIEKLKSQLNSVKQNQEHVVDDNDLRIINKNINDINSVLKDANNLSQQYVQVLQKILAEYMEIVKSHDNQNKGNQTILKAMESTLMQNKSNGSDNIQVFPFVYSRTFYQDFDPFAALRPDKINIRTLQKMMQLVARFDNGPTRAKAGFVDGYYVCGLNTTAGELAKNVGYKPEIFDFKGRQYEKYVKDMFGRGMAISVGYIVSGDEVKKHGIPAISFQMLWDVYLKTQEKIYFTPEGNNHTYTSSSITTVHSNPIPQNTNPPTNKDNIKQESTNIFESGHFAKYKDDVLGFNDEGMAVMKKCKCGGTVSVYLRGEPVYLCEVCGKYYGTLPCNIQEGAFQDLKNGVNPYSDNMVFHVTPDKHIDGQIWKPRVPDYLDPYNPEDTGFEDNTTPRICFSTSIEGCLNGITVNLQRQSPDTFDKMYVYVPEKPWKEYKHKTNKQLVKDKLVYDANVTREVWIMEPVRMKLYGVIRVDQIADAKRKSVVPTSKGQKDTRNYFTYKWHWVVKPKVLKKATKFDYSPERVIDDLCIDVKKFKYGLIRDGRLQTGNVSDADYNKYWVFHSGETVDQAGGGNCYDMVEYEAGYLEAFGVPYKKYFMNFTDTKNTKTINTHTICVVPHNGKFIYIEQAFKRVVDEWGYERKKVFDKLNDIFEYVAEVTAEYENQDLNYGVWDYTNAEIDYGTPIKNFMEWIMTKCKMIYDGEATKSKPVKEGFNLNDYDDDTILECDMFVELGDSMFYVSEYHNALFDDPDAHDEAINEFGILLDSDVEEIITEAAYGPYDEYLKKHGYDPKTNTIADPNRPGKRVNAGRIGSNKERNRMNKFLRENDYDPKTETILTDINDKKNPGQKRRLKFGINSAIGDPSKRMQAPGAYMIPDQDYMDYWYTPDTGTIKFTDDMRKQAKEMRSQGVTEEPGIALSKNAMQSKPSQSQVMFKHEEGHHAHYGDRANFKNDRRSAKRLIDKEAASNPLIRANLHGSSPDEYIADKYAVEHTPKPDLRGGLIRINKDSKKHWESIFRKTRSELIKIYGTESNKETLDKMKNDVKKTYDNYIELYEDEDLSDDPETMKEIHDLKSEIEKGFPNTIAAWKTLGQKSDKEFLKQRTNLKLNDDIVTRELDMRDEYAKRQMRKKELAEKAIAAKQRQLAKEQLKQQIASGKLTGDQAAKAEKKIQRIEAFEANQSKSKTRQTNPVKTAQPKPQTTSSNKPISVESQKLTTSSKPTIKKEGYKLSRFNQSIFQEEEENLSDEMEDITVGDLNLEDEEKTTEEKPDTDDMEEATDEKKLDDNDDFDENGKAYDDENGYDFDPQLLGDTNDIDVEDDELELPGYMKERMSEEDRKEYEQPDENISADNADLGSFGKDTSDVQNDYDPKEIETLMKLMASEADAMNEYMDGAKETNIDVLRRLYADIANEERFHMEQLLFAKSELTGEKYVPKDPEVKDEYEELLKMGMDEETAMQTAVDKCHIRGSMANDDQEATVELQADVEMMEMTINLFNTQFDNIMLMMESNSFKKEEFDHAVDVFMESCIIQEEVANVHVDDNKNARLNSGKHNGPIDILKKSLGTILHLLMSLVRKFVDFLRRTKNRSRAIANYVKRYGVSGLFASSKDTLKLYFIDIDAPACINDSTETLLTLAMDTFNACTRAIGGQPMQINARRDPRMNINGNIERGISLLNGVQLIKTKMILPDDDAKQQNIAACLFGFTENSRAADGTSNNTLNRLKVYADYWTLMMNNVIKSLDRMNIMKTQQGSVYNSNKQKYDLVIKGFESIIKTCKAVVTALQNDISVLMKLNNEAMNASIKKTQESDEKVIQNNDNIKAQNQQYNQVMGKTNQSPQ